AGLAPVDDPGRSAAGQPALDAGRGTVEPVGGPRGDHHVGLELDLLDQARAAAPAARTTRVSRQPVAAIADRMAPLIAFEVALIAGLAMEQQRQAVAAILAMARAARSEADVEHAPQPAAVGGRTLDIEG